MMREDGNDLDARKLDPCAGSPCRGMEMLTDDQSLQGSLNKVNVRTKVNYDEMDCWLSSKKLAHLVYLWGTGGGLWQRKEGIKEM